MKKFQQIGEWEWAIESGRMIEIPVSAGTHRLAYRTAITAEAWQQCIASATRREQIRRLDQFLTSIDFLLEVNPTETEFEFSVCFEQPPEAVRVNLFCSLNAYGHCVATIALAESN